METDKGIVAAQARHIQLLVRRAGAWQYLRTDEAEERSPRAHSGRFSTLSYLTRVDRVTILFGLFVGAGVIQPLFCCLVAEKIFVWKKERLLLCGNKQKLNEYENVQSCRAEAGVNWKGSKGRCVYCSQQAYWSRFHIQAHEERVQWLRVHPRKNRGRVLALRLSRHVQG